MSARSRLLLALRHKFSALISFHGESVDENSSNRHDAFATWSGHAAPRRVTPQHRSRRSRGARASTRLPLESVTVCRKEQTTPAKPTHTNIPWAEAQRRDSA